MRIPHSNRPTQPSVTAVPKPPPRPPGPPRNPLLEELSDLARPGRPSPYRDATNTAPNYPAAGQYSGGFPPATSAAFGPQPDRPRRRKKSKKTGNSSGLVTTLISVFGILGLLCCGGIGGVAFLLAPKTIVLKSGGYEATAQGNRMQQKTEGNTETQGTMHPVTGSEFWIGSVNLPGARAGSLDDLRSYFRNFSDSTQLVQRGSMSGIHCRGVDTGQIGVLGGIDAELEFFVVGNRLLYTAYIPGSSKAALKGKQSKLGDREAKWDNADAFFSSIRPSN
ncbi:MAG: hypothetical protein R3C53_12385 [Pirellulaceae bacterium]